MRGCQAMRLRAAHGMRAVAGAAVAVAAAACTPGERLPGAAPPPPPAGGVPVTVEGLPSAEPALRVGITVDSARAVVGAITDFAIVVAGEEIARARAGETWTFTADGDGRVSGSGPAGATPAYTQAVRIVPTQEAGFTIGGRQYRGEALIVPRGAGRLTAVNVVDLEAYLLGVVPREMGRRPASEIEALKAQAVAARTYAVGNLGGRNSLGFDVYATVMDQVYGGVQDEDSIVSRAIRETRGEIITHGGRPIVAYYSSTCGGRTAAIEDSWPWRGSLPYLRSVSDRVPGTDEYYCSSSSRFDWTTRWTRQELIAVLGQTLRAHTGGAVTSVSRIDNLRITDRNESDRVTVQLTADGRDYTLRADSVRWTLRPQPGPAILNSSKLAALETTSGANGVETVEARGGGWGHAIGMCQVGAMGRARARQSYSQILTAYYTGVEISRLY